MKVLQILRVRVTNKLRKKKKKKLGGRSDVIVGGLSTALGERGDG
jgi:hypothetical protein